MRGLFFFSLLFFFVTLSHALRGLNEYRHVISKLSKLSYRLPAGTLKSEARARNEVGKHSRDILI